MADTYECREKVRLSAFFIFSPINESPEISSPYNEEVYFKN